MFRIIISIAMRDIRSTIFAFMGGMASFAAHHDDADVVVVLVVILWLLLLPAGGVVLSRRVALQIPSIVPLLYHDHQQDTTDSEQQRFCRFILLETPTIGLLVFLRRRRCLWGKQDFESAPFLPRKLGFHTLNDRLQ